MNDVMDFINRIVDALKVFSGGILAFGTVSATIVALVKPLRKKFTNWFSMKARTPYIVERLDEIDAKIKSVNDDIVQVKDTLVQHTEGNSSDIKALAASQIISLRRHIRDIYKRNLPHKCLSLFEHRDIHELGEQYFALHGNGYIKNMIEEMKTWPVCPGLQNEE